MAGEPSRKRKDVNLEDNVLPKRPRAKKDAIVHVRRENVRGAHGVAEAEEVPFIDDIPEIVVDDEEDDGAADAPEVDAPEVDRPSSGSSGVPSIAPPIVAAEDVDPFENHDGDSTFFDDSDDEEDDEEDDENEDDQEEDGGWRVIPDLDLQWLFGVDPELYAESQNSLINRRLPEVILDRRQNMSLWHELCIMGMTSRAWSNKNEIVEYEHELARPLLSHLPEERWGSKHLFPSSPRIPIKRLKKRKCFRRKRRNFVDLFEGAQRAVAATTEPELSIEISGAFVEDGQPLNEVSALDAKDTGAIPELATEVGDHGGSAVKSSARVVKDDVSSGCLPHEEKPDEAALSLGDYPEIPSDDETEMENVNVGRTHQSERHHHVVVNSPPAHFWSETSDPMLWDMLHGIPAPM